MLLALFTTAYSAEWSQSLSLGVNLARGNTENTQVNSRYDGKRTTKKDTIDLNAAANFGEDDVQKNTDNYLLSAQYSRIISNRLFWLVKSSYEIDNIADLDYRFQFTPGLGYKVINKEGNTWDIEAGLGYQSEQFDQQSAEDSLAFRFAEKWDYKLSETSSIWHSAEIVGDVDEGNDYIVKAVIGIQSKVAGNLSLKSFIEDRYTNQPANNNKKNDITFNTVLVYSF